MAANIRRRKVPKPLCRACNTPIKEHLNANTTYCSLECHRNFHMIKNRKDKTCKQCNRAFEDRSRYGSNRYCSKSCRQKAHSIRMRARGRRDVKCEVCGDMFETAKPNKVTCSKDCSAFWNDNYYNRITGKPMKDYDKKRFCITCNAPIDRSKSRATKYCSHSCRQAFYTLRDM